MPLKTERGGSRGCSFSPPWSDESPNAACPGETLKGGAVDALHTLSAKGQLVIQARLRQLLGLQAGDRLALTLEADGLRFIPQDSAKTSSAKALIGCMGYQGSAIDLEAMDPALFAKP